MHFSPFEYIQFMTLLVRGTGNLQIRICDFFGVVLGSMWCHFKLVGPTSLTISELS